MTNSCVYIPTNTIPDSNVLEALLEIDGPHSTLTSSFCVIGKEKNDTLNIINSRCYPSKDLNIVRDIGEGLTTDDILVIKNSYSNFNDPIKETPSDIICLDTPELNYDKLITLYTSSFKRNIKVSVENMNQSDLHSGVIVDLLKQKIYVVSYDDYFYFGYVRGYGFIISSNKNQLYSIISTIKGSTINNDFFAFDNDFYVKESKPGTIYEIDPITRSINNISFYPEDKLDTPSYSEVYNVMFNGCFDSVLNTAILGLSQCKTNWYILKDDPNKKDYEQIISCVNSDSDNITEYEEANDFLFGTILRINPELYDSEKHDVSYIILPTEQKEVKTNSINNYLKTSTRKGGKNKIVNICKNLTYNEKKALLSHLVNKKHIELPHGYGHFIEKDDDDVQYDMLDIIGKILLSPINIKVLLRKL